MTKIVRYNRKVQVGCWWAYMRCEIGTSLAYYSFRLHLLPLGRALAPSLDHLVDAAHFPEELPVETTTSSRLQLTTSMAFVAIGTIMDNIEACTTAIFRDVHDPIPAVMCGSDGWTYTAYKRNGHAHSQYDRSPGAQ